MGGLFSRTPDYCKPRGSSSPALTRVTAASQCAKQGKGTHQECYDKVCKKCRGKLSGGCIPETTEAEGRRRFREELRKGRLEVPESQQYPTAEEAGFPTRVEPSPPLPPAGGRRIRRRRRTTLRKSLRKNNIRKARRNTRRKSRTL